MNRKNDDTEPVLVFLHYFGGSARSWKWVIDKLSDNYLCIALDLPGFGSNPSLDNPSIDNFANYVLKNLKELNIKSCILIGHSMGGKIACQVAINDRGDLVQKLVLVAPSPPTTEPLTDDERWHMLNHPVLREAKRSVDNATKQTLTEEQYLLAVETQLISEEKTWKWWILDGMNHSIAEQAKKLSLPITILASKDDPIITPSIIQERVISVFVGGKLIVTDGVGHLSPMEVPDWVAGHIDKVVRSND